MSDTVKPYTTLAELDAAQEEYDRNFYRIAEGHERGPDTRLQSVEDVHARLLATAKLAVSDPGAGEALPTMEEISQIIQAHRFEVTYNGSLASDTRLLAAISRLHEAALRSQQQDEDALALLIEVESWLYHSATEAERWSVAASVRAFVCARRGDNPWRDSQRMETA